MKGVIEKRLIFVAILVFFVGKLYSQNTAEEFVKRGDSKFNNADYKGAIEDYTEAIRLDSIFEKTTFVW